MMIHSIRVQDFLSHVDSEVCFSDGPLWLISGENGAGKSAFFDALEYALYGQHRGATENPNANEEPRGSAQNANLLVRNGSDGRKAVIQVRFALGADEFWLTHTIGASGGNQGGRLQRQNAGGWQEVNVGRGVAATWNWLRPKLPPHGLFRSAIYLRQGQTARFLRGTPAHRIQRFAMLIDLDRYTRLSKSAGIRARAATSARAHAEAQRELLGDTSEVALTAAQAAVADGEAACEFAKQAVAAAAATATGAHAWAHLRAAEAQLAERRERVRQLLADAEQIRTAAAQVDRWERAVTTIDGYRLATKRARASRAQAADLREKAEVARAAAEQQGVSLAQQKERQQIVADTELPAARTTATHMQAQQQALAVEQAIAVAHSEHAAALAAQAKLAGADEALTGWQDAQVALGLLGGLAQAAAGVAAAEAQATSTTQALARAEDAAQQAETAESAAQTAEVAARELLDTLTAQVNELAQDEVRLSAQIDQRSQLGGDEAACPVCAQELGPDAHAHVQQVLSAERQQLGIVRAELAGTRGEVQLAAERHKAAQREAKAAATAHAKATTALAVAKEQRTQAGDRVTLAQAGLTTAREAAQQRCQMYADHLDTLTEVWLRDEGTRVASELATATTRAHLLTKANAEVGAKAAVLDARRSNRAVGAEPLGDTASVEALAVRAAAMLADLKTAQTSVRTLEAEASALQTAIITLTEAVTKLRGQAAAALEQAAQADTLADGFEGDAAKAAAALGAVWAEVLASDAAYEAERVAVEASGPMAARAGELEQVGAAQAEIDQTERQLQEQAARLAPAHQQPPEDADAAYAQAQERERERNEQLGAIKNALKQLDASRETHARLSQAIDEAATQEATYKTLETLLKEGGPIQVALAGQEQRRIVEDVNDVLERLGDSLRTQLGEARRESKVGIEDIHVLETTDSSGAPRFFEYLSGGEQFRIALALALALHRRVGREAGTLIVDEGFGALDSRRRHELAARLTDTTTAILDREMARSIVICSHSEEVQQQFPNRWHVRKQGDTATVSRMIADDLSDDDSALG